MQSTKKNVNVNFYSNNTLQLSFHFSENSFLLSQLHRVANCLPLFGDKQRPQKYHRSWTWARGCSCSLYAEVKSKKNTLLGLPVVPLPQDAALWGMSAPCQQLLCKTSGAHSALNAPQIIFQDVYSKALCSDRDAARDLSPVCLFSQQTHFCH